jgi:hypothetical protein
MPDQHRATGSAGGGVDALAVLASLPSRAWSTLKTVYWANSPTWSVFKSGALVFLGFFLWAGSNILHSYVDSSLLYYPMAYGFVLVLYGPLHHLVVIPLALKWRRGGGPKQRVGRRLPNGMLAAFLAVVLVLGTFPAGAMTVDFQAHLGSDASSVSPDMDCVKTPAGDGTRVTCTFSNTEGVGAVVVKSDGATLTTIDEPPFEFTVRERELGTVMGETQFTVVVRDEDGAFVRRYTRRLAVVPDG